MRTNREIVFKSFKKEYNVFLNLDNINRVIQPGFVVKYYSRKGKIDIVDEAFIDQFPNLQKSPQLTLDLHGYEIGNVKVIETHLSSASIRAELKFGRSNSLILSTYNSQEHYITPYDLLREMKKSGYNREKWNDEYKGHSIVLKSIFAEGVTLVTSRSSLFNWNSPILVMEGSSSSTSTPLHIANPQINFIKRVENRIGENIIARKNIYPLFALYTPRFDINTGELKSIRPYGFK